MSSNLNSADDSPNDLPTFYRKSNDAIALRPVEGSISLLARKVFNVMILHAQEQGTPGKIVPGNDVVFKSFYWLPLSEFTRSLEYESRDILTLKDVLEDMRRLKLVGESEHRWALAGLISSAIIVKASDPNNHTGQSWIGFSFPPHLQNEIIAPNEYTKFSLTYQSLMRSGASLALYEICRRFATNPSKVTYVRPLDFWYSAITGNSLEGREFEYKYFKRDVIKDAIQEINKTTDILVDLIEHKTGRKITELQFKVEMKRQSTFVFEDRGLIDSGVIERIVKLGFGKSAAYTIYGNYPLDVIEVALASIELKIKESGKGNTTEIENLSQYFRWLLSRGMRSKAKTGEISDDQAENMPISKKRTPVNHKHEVSQLEQIEVKEKKRKSGSQLMNKYLADRGERAYEKYVNLSEAERITIYQSFSEANANTGFKVEKGLALKSIRKIFGIWYAKKIWGDPTAEAVAEFAANL